MNLKYFHLYRGQILLMRKLIYIPFLLLIPLYSLFGQVNQKSNSNNFTSNQIEVGNIKDINVDLNTNEYYKQQTFFWNENAVKNKADAVSWYNYYKASRFEISTKQHIIIPKVYQNELDKIVAAMGENVSNTYEYNYIKYWNGNFNPDFFPFLEKAYELNPLNTELYDDFVSYYEITDNEEKKKEFCTKWYETGEFPQDLYDYNYNLLMSLGKNSILVTNGFNDTYPLWILQEVAGVRPDITLLNIKMLSNEEYRDQKLKDLDLMVSVKSDYSLYPEEFYRDMCQNNPEKDIYFSMTVPVKIFQSMLDQLYPTGLALKYSMSDFDNVREIQKLWEKKFRTDYLDNPTSEYNVNMLNKNYLISLSLLENYFNENNMLEKAEEIKRIKENILTKSIK